MFSQTKTRQLWMSVLLYPLIHLDCHPLKRNLKVGQSCQKAMDKCKNIYIYLGKRYNYLCLYLLKMKTSQGTTKIVPLKGNGGKGFIGHGWK